MTSALASAQSAYLKSAAHQPVRWYPWGTEAFERARAEHKPILLDIGAVWCHWCHVMDGESYENPEIAEILNRDWICIKVDRDERPDVDARYQRAVQALTGQGGWPLTAFLTASGDVFYGGTYFPPDGRHGRPGFASVLTELARIYREQPDRVTTQAGEIRKHVAETLSESRAGKLDPDLLVRAADAMAQVFDFRYGGFGTQPKFPHPGACEFLLARWFDTGERWAREAVDRTLTAMAHGGVYDQIGGGFHRYSVDARWIVPHFEKMLYDNSELLRVYVHAAGTGAGSREPGAESSAPPASSAPEYRRVVEGIVDWVTTVMSDPHGGYFASQDADVGLHDDGDYFTWTPEEVQAVTTEDEYAALSRRYDIDDVGEMHHNPKKNVLWVKQSVREISVALERPEEEVERLLQSGIDRLRRARAARPAPFVDRTLYTGWNAMMASALLEAASLLDDGSGERGAGGGTLERHALATLERIFREASDGDGATGVRHAIGSAIGGILEDQVHVANACIDAYEATGSALWLQRATRLAEHVWSEFAAEDGGLTDTARGRGGEGFLDQPIKPVQDSPTPSPNGVAGIVAARLAEHTGDSQWRDRLERLLSAFAGGAAELSIHGATFLRALDWYFNPPAHVVIVGDARTAEVKEMWRVARVTYRPRKVITQLAPTTHDSRLPTHVKAMIDGKAPRAYVCAGAQCGPPAKTPDDLRQTLVTLGVT